MTVAERSGIGASVADLKQACLDLSNTALTLFDAFDAHGKEAMWAQGSADAVLALVAMQEAHAFLTDFLRFQSVSRMLALGVSPETLLKRAGRG